jgi:LytR cell envelope-related transcriptional attenuator
MSMLSGQGLSPSGEGQRRRHPVTTVVVVLLMMAVLFGATFGVVRLLRGGGSSAPDASSGTPGPCVTTTVRPGVVLPKPGTVTANVYNATDRAGLARRTSTVLATRGFTIGHVANDPLGKTLTTVAEIRFGPKGEQNAQLMRYYVTGAVLVQDARTDATVDVVLGQKFVAVAPQPKVDAALAKPTAVVTGPGCTPSPTPSRTTTTSTRSTTPAPSAS